jgi:hypothetical protein
MVSQTWVLLMERNNGKPGLRILMTRKMLLLSELKLDLLTDHGFRLTPKLLLTRVKNSRTHHLQPLSQNMLKELREAKLLLTEETVSQIWVLFTEKSNGRDGLKTLTTKKIRPLLEPKLDPHTDHGSKLRLLHTKVKSSSNLLQLLLCQMMHPWDQDLLLLEETDSQIWALFTVKKDGKTGLKT